MASADLIRWGGLAAMGGSVLGIAVAPVITSAYSLSESGREQVPPWEPELSTLFSPLFGFASPEGVYATYGKLYLLVFLGFLLGLRALRAQRRSRVGRSGKWGFGLSLLGAILNLLGNIADYWMGEDILGEGLHTLGFLAGTMLGLLLLVVGSTMLCIALLRAGTVSRFGAWLLALSCRG